MDQGHLQLLYHYLKEPKVIADHYSLGRLLVEHRQLRNLALRNYDIELTRKYLVLYSGGFG